MFEGFPSHWSALKSLIWLKRLGIGGQVPIDSNKVGYAKVGTAKCG